MKYLRLVSLCLGLFFIAAPSHAQSVYQYTESTIDFFNPERGMYRYTEARTADGYLALDSLALESLVADDKQSLIYRIIYLDGFYNAPISTEILDLIEDDFTLLRNVGLKAIVRFAYTDTLEFDVNDFPLPPFDDTPDPALVFEHIGQLGPILAANSDVILTVHNGFYGIFGENYYSDDFGSLYQAPISPAQQARRDSVTDTLLSILPLDRTVSVRYPYLKTDFLGLTIPDDSLTAATAFQGTDISRIAYHNDCFLADFNDFTFSDTLTEKPYWEAESRYVLMGGETCRDTTEFTQCSNALLELERFHWTYINDFFNPDVLLRWENEGCFDEIRQRLGYRLVLREATLPEFIGQDQEFTVSLEIENVGWAAPMLPRGAELVLRNAEGPGEYFLTLTDLDLRRCGGGEVCSYDLDVIADNTVPPGKYNVLLFLPDGRASLRNNPRFSIRLANEDLWEPLTGMNKLQHLAVVMDEIVCRADTTINTGDITSGIYRASNDMIVETGVEPDAIVQFEAGNSIVFRPGFSALNGTSVKAIIRDCSPEPPAPLQETVAELPVSNIAEDLTDSSLRIWPNPSNGKLQLNYSADSASIESGEFVPALLLDAFGRRLDQINLFPGQTQTLDLSDLPNGMYFITWQDASGHHIEKLIRK